MGRVGEPGFVLECRAESGAHAGLAKSRESAGPSGDV